MITILTIKVVLTDLTSVTHVTFLSTARLKGSALREPTLRIPEYSCPASRLDLYMVPAMLLWVKRWWSSNNTVT